MNAMRQLATQLKGRTKHGEQNVFLYVDLKKYARWLLGGIEHVGLHMCRGFCHRIVLNSCRCPWIRTSVGSRIPRKGAGTGS